MGGKKESEAMDLEGFVEDVSADTIDIDNGEVYDAKLYVLIKDSKGELFHTVMTRRFKHKNKDGSIEGEDYAVVEDAASTYLTQLRKVITEGASVKVRVRETDAHFYEVLGKYAIMGNPEKQKMRIRNKNLSKIDNLK